MKTIAEESDRIFNLSKIEGNLYQAVESLRAARYTMTALNYPTDVADKLLKELVTLEDWVGEAIDERLANVVERIDAYDTIRSSS